MRFNDLRTKDCNVDFLGSVYKYFGDPAVTDIA